MTDDVLRLSRPNGKDDAVNALADDKQAAKHALAYENKEIARLEKNIADLKKANQLKDELEASKKQPNQAKAPAPSPAGKTRHVAHATKDWKAVCTAPDVCRVGKDLVAFDSFATLEKKNKASDNVKARGSEVYRKGDLVKGVQADAGKHVTAGTSQGSGHVKILEGHDSVKVGADKIPIARHDSKCLVNCDANGNGGAPGKLVTEQKTLGGAPASKASNPNAPPGQRTSPQLDALKDMKAKIESGQLDFNALDQYVPFKPANDALDGWIGGIKGTPGGATDYLAQGARGLLGFGKDVVMGVGELAYEGIKGVPKLLRSAYTSEGQALNQINGAILAEDIRLGNITPGTIGQGALDIGAAIVKPVTDPWNRGDTLESIARGLPEVLTLPIAWTKAQRAAQAAKAKAALDAAEAAKAKAALDAAEATKAKAALEAEEAAKVGGVHVSGKPVTKNGYNYYVDDKGRVTKVEGDLTLNKEQGRNQKAQLEAGGADRLPDDQGGHFIGRRFNGPTDEINHFAQNGNFNQGAYKSLENSWEKALNNGQSVRVEVNTTYIGDSLRPDTLTVRQWIDGVPSRPITFNNVRGGK
jgi:DNA/RNA non-specific endonuclease